MVIKIIDNKFSITDLIGERLLETENEVFDAYVAILSQIGIIKLDCFDLNKDDYAFLVKPLRDSFKLANENTQYVLHNFYKSSKDPFNYELNRFPYLRIEIMNLKDVKLYTSEEGCWAYSIESDWDKYNFAHLAEYMGILNRHWSRAADGDERFIIDLVKIAIKRFNDNSKYLKKTYYKEVIK